MKPIAYRLASPLYHVPKAERKASERRSKEAERRHRLLAREYQQAADVYGMFPIPTAGLRGPRALYLEKARGQRALAREAHRLSRRRVHR